MIQRKAGVCIFILRYLLFSSTVLLPIIYPPRNFVNMGNDDDDNDKCWLKLSEIPTKLSCDFPWKQHIIIISIIVFSCAAMEVSSQENLLEYIHEEMSRSPIVSFCSFTYLLNTDQVKTAYADNQTKFGDMCLQDLIDDRTLMSDNERKNKAHMKRYILQGYSLLIQTYRSLKYSTILSHEIRLEFKNALYVKSCLFIDTFFAKLCYNVQVLSDLFKSIQYVLKPSPEYTDTVWQRWYQSIRNYKPGKDQCWFIVSEVLAFPFFWLAHIFWFWPYIATYVVGLYCYDWKHRIDIFEIMFPVLFVVQGFFIIKMRSVCNQMKSFLSAIKLFQLPTEYENDSLGDHIKDNFNQLLWSKSHDNILVKHAFESSKNNPTISFDEKLINQVKLDIEEIIKLSNDLYLLSYFVPTCAIVDSLCMLHVLTLQRDNTLLNKLPYKDQQCISYLRNRNHPMFFSWILVWGSPLLIWKILQMCCFLVALSTILGYQVLTVIGSLFVFIISSFVFIIWRTLSLMWIIWKIIEYACVCLYRFIVLLKKIIQYK